MSRKRALYSTQLTKLGRRLTESRQSHPPRTRLPERLWQAATSLATHEGLYRTARALHLDYASLKKKVEMSSKKGQAPRRTSSYRTRTFGYRLCAAWLSLRKDLVCDAEKTALRGQPATKLDRSSAGISSERSAWRPLVPRSCTTGHFEEYPECRHRNDKLDKRYDST
jgi:hypothetical protein